jgi:hypothetical protein
MSVIKSTLAGDERGRGEGEEIETKGNAVL